MSPERFPQPGDDAPGAPPPLHRDRTAAAAVPAAPAHCTAPNPARAPRLLIAACLAAAWGLAAWGLAALRQRRGRNPSEPGLANREQIG